MAITLAQLDTAIDAAFAAINVGELSFTTVSGNTVQFNSLKSMQEHINWLQKQRSQLVDQAAADSDSGGYSPAVQFQEAGS